MFHITVLCIGKLKENYYKEAIQEYVKRLSKYCVLEIQEFEDEKIPDKLNPKLIETIKEKEDMPIVQHCKKDSYIISLDLAGKQYTSSSFSEKIQDIGLTTTNHITFIIGGSLGLSKTVLQHSNELISFSKLTFPHPLIRVFLLEQVFRSFKIMHGETYHK